MNKPLDKLLVVDIECTAWEKPKDQPPGQKNEIIKIGIVPVLLTDLSIGIPISLLVKPTTSKISPFCAEITTVNQDMADTGIPFKKACKKLIKELSSKEIPWVSWGDYDKKQFLYQCHAEEYHYPFGAGHTNFQYVFAMIMGLDKEVKLAEAVKILGLEFLGARHRDANEALNIARVITEMYRRVRETK